MIPHFEWDLDKARENVQKHGVSFEEAAGAFGDDDAVVADDLNHDDDEDRFIIIAMSARERVLLTIYTIRREDTVRVISSRRATRYERRTYDTKKNDRRS